MNPTSGKQLCCRYRPKCWYSVTDLPPSAYIANLLGAALPKKLLEVVPGNKAGPLGAV